MTRGGFLKMRAARGLALWSMTSVTLLSGVTVLAILMAAPARPAALA